MYYDMIYDDESSTFKPGAAPAKHELTQQIFTKTMAVQVWKPEYERAGRHFFYTRQYVIFFAKLLTQLDDRMGMEALAKRVRKRSMDFWNHQRVWEAICRGYLEVRVRAGTEGCTRD